MVANPPSCSFALAAEQLPVRRSSLGEGGLAPGVFLPAPRSFSGGETSPHRTRVWGFRQSPSGRLSRRRRRDRAIATGSARCAYKTASGRGKWPSRDPIGDKGGLNYYSFVENGPNTKIDPDGRDIFVDPGPIDPLNPFLQHYYAGSGAEYDLILRGHYDEIQRVFAPEIGEWRERARKDAELEAERLSNTCRNSGRVIKSHISLRGQRVTPNVTLRDLGSGFPGLAFILGNTAFLRGYEIDVEIVCCYCSYTFSGRLFWGIRDRFERPIDGLPIEPGGVPYRLWADWTESIDGGGVVKTGNCK